MTKSPRNILGTAALIVGGLTFLIGLFAWSREAIGAGVLFLIFAGFLLYPAWQASRNKKRVAEDVAARLAGRREEEQKGTEPKPPPTRKYPPPPPSNQYP